MKTANFSYPDSGLRIPFSLDAMLTSLPAYCAAGSTASLLDPLIEFLNDGSYVLGIRAIPTTQQQNASNLIQANQTYEDNINVPEGSFLTIITACCLNDTQRLNTQPFRVKLFDVGSQSYLSDDFVHGFNLAGCINRGSNFVWSQQDRPDTSTVGAYAASHFALHGFFVLPSPIAISSPGQLGVQIVNLNDTEVSVEMAFYFAIPIGDHSSVGPASVSGNFNRTSRR